jgi:hypothetical protein
MKATVNWMKARMLTLECEGWNGRRHPGIAKFSGVP